MSGLTPCDSCPAPCCRRFVVDVTTYDAYRLGAGLKLSMGDFAELIWLEEPDPKRRILLGDPQRYYRLVLRRVPDLEARAEDPGALRCSFLLPLGGLFITIFAGWVMCKNSTAEELDIGTGAAYRWWRFLARWVAPAAVLLVFLHATGLLRLLGLAQS